MITIISTKTGRISPEGFSVVGAWVSNQCRPRELAVVGLGLQFSGFLASGSEGLMV